MIYQYDALGPSIFKRDSGGPTVRDTEAGSVTWLAEAASSKDAKTVVDVLNELLVAAGRRRVEP